MKNRIAILIVLIVLVVTVFLLNRHLQTCNLFSAIDSGNYNKAKSAIDFGAAVNGYKYLVYIPDVVMMNPTPLVQACKVGNEEIIKLLLTHGADVNLPDKITGKTPLLAALHGTKQNRYSLAFYLIRQGANINIALDNNSPIAECLLFSTDDSESTCAEGYSLFCYLLENGSPLDGIPFNENALTYAVHYGNYDATKYLLDKYIFSVDSLDENGCTALISAVKHNQVEIVDLLLSYGANIELVDSMGLCAVDYAIQNENQLILDMLLFK